MARKTNALDMKALLDLPAKRRADIAVKLIESLDDEIDADAAEMWDREIERRVVELREGKAKTVSWATVKKELRPRGRRQA